MLVRILLRIVIAMIVKIIPMTITTIVMIMIPVFSERIVAAMIVL